MFLDEKAAKIQAARIVTQEEQDAFFSAIHQEQKALREQAEAKKRQIRKPANFVKETFPEQKHEQTRDIMGKRIGVFPVLCGQLLRRHRNAALAYAVTC